MIESPGKMKCVQDYHDAHGWESSSDEENEATSNKKHSNGNDSDSPNPRSTDKDANQVGKEANLRSTDKDADQVGKEAQDCDEEEDEEDYINSLTVDNAVDELAYADRHTFKKMKEDVSRFILDNAEEIMSTPAWGDISHKLKDELFLKACVGNRKRSFPSAFRG